MSSKNNLPRTLEEKIKWARQHEYDCIVQCPKCNRTQYLEFKNGLKNGWSTCCGGYTMTIVWHDVDIAKTVGEIIKSSLRV
jgi:hypothetical protein